MKDKIVFIIANMAGGGAEKMLSLLLTHISKDRVEPVLLLYKKEGIYLKELPASVKVYDFGIDIYKGRKKSKILSLAYNTLRFLIQQKPKIVVSYTFYPDLITALARLFYPGKVRHLMSEHTNLSKNLIIHKNVSLITKRIISFLFNSADSILTVSEDVKEDLIRKFHVSRQRLIKLSNCLDLEEINKLKNEKVDHPWFDGIRPLIIAVGRLIKVKNFSFLIESYAELVKKVDCKLVILGEGRERQQLESLIRKLEIADGVALLGFQDNPFKFMAKSSVFVCPSLFEGFSLVCLEAMACAVPVVSSDSYLGLNEIVENNKTGLVVSVDNKIELIKAIEELLMDNKKREFLVRNGLEKVRNFSLDNYIAAFEDLVLFG